MRLFVAIVPPEDILEDLADYLGPRQEAGPALRWTDPHQWHLTLAFMGATPERVLDDLTERLARVASRFSPMVLRIAEAGCFPHVARARVLWCGVSDEPGALPPLARSVRGVAAKAGAEPEGGRFRGHITLARLPRPSDATRWVRVLEAYAGPSWTAREITLVQSHLGEGRGGRPRYEEVGSFPLGRPTK
jgi:2'-5' RNA ligase